MTPIDPQTDDVTITVRAVMPQLRRASLEAMILIALGIGIMAIGVVTFFAPGVEDKSVSKFAGLVMLIGLLAILGAYRRLRQKQESLVMPILAGAVGLSYSKDAASFIRQIPTALLPARGLRKGEDQVSGKLGAHEIHMAEVRVVTGGKNSKTLFQGLVVQFPNRVPMPDFFLALEDKTRPGLIFNNDLKTGGMRHLRSVTGAGGLRYGVWSTWSGTEDTPALSAVLEVLTQVQHHLGSGVELYSAISTGSEMHLALSHKRNLFSLGGLFPDEKRLFAEVSTALQDLQVPLRLAEVLMSAEERAVAQG